MDLDGSNLETVYEDLFSFSDVSGIALDYRPNLLYWALNNTNSQVIKYLNMTAWDSAYRHMGVLVSLLYCCNVLINCGYGILVYLLGHMGGASHSGTPCYCYYKDPEESLEIS